MTSIRLLKLAGNAITATLTSWSVGFAALGWSYLRAALLPLLLWTLIIVYVAGERRGEKRMAEALTNGEHES